MITQDQPTGLQAQARERPWLQWYEPGVPANVEIPNHPLPYFLHAAAQRHPSRAAVRFLGEQLAYRDLDEAANRFAHALLRLGLHEGDRVALLLPNCPQMVIAFYGALRAGMVVVPTSPLDAETELIEVWGKSEARAVVCLSRLYPHVEGVRKNLPSLGHVIVTNIKEYMPLLTRLAYGLLRESAEGDRVHLAVDGHTHWFQALLARSPDRDLSSHVLGDDLALLQPTGGTTGTPKLAMLTHRNLLANAMQVKAWVSNLTKPDGSDVFLGVVPLFHIYGITTILNFVLVDGGTMILQPRVVLKDMLKAISHEKPEFFPGIPTIYAAINNAPHLERYNLRSLKAAISGAAPLPLEVQTRFEALTGARLVEGYGLTEAAPVTHCTPLQGKRKIGSIGVPLPGTDAAIFDQETGTRSLAPGEVGELAVRGPQVMQGYWRQDDETARVLRDGWLFTGDLARVDEDGFFAIVDRKKDLIISGGLNVFPREIEEPLYQHPKVRKAVAVGVPDPKWGEAVKVYIVLKDGETATVEEIIAYCRDRMAHYKVPKHVEFRHDLPENIVGKVLRRKLRDEEAAKQRATRSEPGPG